ncbi:hypothetical protein ABEH27_18385 [Pseudomonas sp. P39-UII1]|uniref:NACHT domain-containing protein n=1 Tax=Pseudomonas sp. P39-UII1 TaxID=3080333 RepID=UPI00320B2097
MDYDFSRLSTRSFEQLVQAVSLATLGSGVSVFGDGPDGGREATFDGLQDFPTAAAPWNGYGVIQAKFRQRATSGNSAWAVRELRAELTKLSKNSGLKKPEFYIFVTNVILTPVATSGGKDRITALIDKYKDRLGIKDFKIWDYDQLCCFLDLYPSIRNTYKAWVTPGDVLAALVEFMQPKTASFRDVMLNFVQKELRGEQYVNLGQAGHNNKDRIPLATVFVDLPIQQSGVVKEYGAFIPSSVASRTGKASNAIGKLSQIAGQLLDPDSISKKMSATPHGLTRHPGKIVFIGGPGQGKSTVTQFFCQLHRCAFIRQHSLRTLSHEVDEACKLIIQQSGEEGVEAPSNARFPIRIELNKFAAALANGGSTSLFGFILNRIKERSERDLTSDDLRSWLSNYPWLIALDGLDEVPASSNREQVLETIQDFLIDAVECNADIMLVATSRPQGYDDDFSQSSYTHYKLTELDSDHALHYAEKLIKRRWGDDEDKIQTLVARMKRACEDESTTRLMKSPLQVTIMALLVESLGEPPKERWRLFNEYYQVINRREKERDIPAAKLLNSYQADIDYIHQKVGVHLQVESERSGKTDALLTELEFSDIIDSRLAAEGHQGKEGEQFKNDVIEAAFERLVFLVAPQEGRVGFEIRSLQEFMAAQAITSGSDANVVSRLRSIAHASHWRNVFLFAAGRCFYERQHLRDNIFAICSELNDGGVSDVVSGINKALLIGSELALDIIEDGAISNQPGQLRIFTRLALRLLDSHSKMLFSRLGQVYRPAVEDLFVEAISQKLRDRYPEARMGAWQVLLELVKSNVEWAVELAEREWPVDRKEAAQIAESKMPSEPSTWIAQRWFSAILEKAPDYMHFHYLPNLGGYMDSPAGGSIIELPKWYENFARAMKARESFTLTLPGIGQNFEFIAFKETLLEGIDFVPADSNVSPWWQWLCDCTLFSYNPSKEYLAKIVFDASKLIETGNFKLVKSWLWSMPWQVSSILDYGYSAAELEMISACILRGEMGDKKDWLEATTRWEGCEVTIADLAYAPEHDRPFDSNIGSVGFPRCNSSVDFRFGDYDPDVAQSLYKLYQIAKSRTARRMIACGITILCNYADDGVLLDLNICEGLAEIIHDSSTEWLEPTLLNMLPLEFWETEGVHAVLTALLDCLNKDSSWSYEPTEVNIEELQRFIERYPELPNAVILLSRFIVVGREVQYQKSIFSIESIRCCNLKLAEISIYLARKDCSARDGERLAIIVHEMIVQDIGVGHIFEMLRESTTVTDGTQSFVYKLLDIAGPSNQSLRLPCLFLLRRHQKRHLSHEPESLCA